MDFATVLAERLPGLACSGASPDLWLSARDLWPRGLVDIQRGELARNRPAAVIWPERAEQIAQILELARVYGFRVVPFGAGSGVCGAVLPDDRTVVIDSKRLLDFQIDPHAPVVRAGAGVLGIDLEAALGRAGYTVGHFPSSIVCSTVGGWVAARGAGQCSSRYGKIEDMIAGLECVLGTGDFVALQRRRSGPDLVPLVTGSEGTLGFITNVTLRLHPAPRTRKFLTYSCASIERGFDLLRGLMQAGLRPEVARLYDPIDSVLLAQSSGRKSAKKGGASGRGSLFASLARGALSRPRLLQRAIELCEGNLLGGATLLLIFEGTPGQVESDASLAANFCWRAGARSLGEGPARAWLDHRYSVSFRQSSAFRLGAFTDTMEVAAPWSKLEAVYANVRRALSEHALVMAHLSHAYPDGCSLYFTFSALGRGAGDSTARYDAAFRAGLDAALAAGANLSHHHGVGRSKAALLSAELGQGTELLQSLRRAWDPSRLFNPGALEAPATPVETAASTARTPAAFSLDEQSQLVEVDARLSLGGIQSLLSRRGLSLPVSACCDWSSSVASWIALGFPGSEAAWDDPVATKVAGFVARVGALRANVRAAPRRATGPDLLSLFAGTGTQIGQVERATLAVRARSAPVPRVEPFNWPRDPPPNATEEQAFERVRRVFESR